ncbi:MAG: Ribonuclease G [candidate division TM6 bacterium GW2011_GWE2_41_16]|nr:MAG: Ribonuclease G [candidate division TM6 bacterium GW2011_GWE2_41_16]
MKKIVISHDPWQTRTAVLESDGRLQNMYYTSPKDETLERSFFKGVVMKVLPGIQTAFVDIDQDKAGFLHISDVDRSLAIKRMSRCDGFEDEDVEEDEEGKETLHCEPDINKILKEGEHILVQVNKEPVYEKGPKLTTCFTIPGRFLVLMPNVPRIGISKKIENPEERTRLRDLVRSHLPACMGAIIRTTSDGCEEKDLVREIKYLLGTWEEIEKNYKEALPKKLIHKDIDPVLQIIRDNLDDNIEAVICDNAEVHARILSFVKKTASDLTYKIVLHNGEGHIFTQYHIDEQIEKALNKKVHLKSGGSLIIESTEAMTVIDVNTGRYTGSKNLEETLYNTNLEAAEEVVRQLRLRNIGGIIVIDFIDMASHTHRQNLFRSLERFLRERDKFQSVVLRVSEFGLVQMTRKRTGRMLTQQLLTDCRCCRGTGFEKNVQEQTYSFLRMLRDGLAAGRYRGTINAQVHKDVFTYVIEHEYDALIDLEKMYKVKIVLSAHEDADVSSFALS